MFENFSPSYWILSTFVEDLKRSSRYSKMLSLALNSVSSYSLEDTILCKKTKHRRGDDYILDFLVLIFHTITTQERKISRSVGREFLSGVSYLGRTLLNPSF